MRAYIIVTIRCAAIPMARASFDSSLQQVLEAVRHQTIALGGHQFVFEQHAGWENSGVSGGQVGASPGSFRRNGGCKFDSPYYHRGLCIHSGAVLAFGSSAKLASRGSVFGQRLGVHRILSRGERSQQMSTLSISYRDGCQDCDLCSSRVIHG